MNKSSCKHREKALNQRVLPTITFATTTTTIFCVASCHPSKREAILAESTPAAEPTFASGSCGCHGGSFKCCIHINVCCMAGSRMKYP